MSHSLVQFLHIDRFGWRSLADILVLAIIIFAMRRASQGALMSWKLNGRCAPVRSAP